DEPSDRVQPQSPARTGGARDRGGAASARAGTGRVRDLRVVRRTDSDATAHAATVDAPVHRMPERAGAERGSARAQAHHRLPLRGTDGQRIHGRPPRPRVHCAVPGGGRSRSAQIGRRTAYDAQFGAPGKRGAVSEVLRDSLGRHPGGRRVCYSAARMSSDDAIEFEGKVVEVLTGGTFKVNVGEGHDVIAKLAGKMRRYRIRVVLGDRVTVAVSPYDPTRGRITYRPR